MGATDLSRLSRRDFLKNGLVFGAGAAGLAAGYAAVPDVFARAVYGGKRDGVMNDRVLVMIQLAGGADGLQTVIPLQDPKLRALRPQLSQAANTALPLDASFGLNRSMRGVKALWDQGKVAIVHGVGYPQPNYSHFDSIRIWETGDPLRRPAQLIISGVAANILHVTLGGFDTHDQQLARLDSLMGYVDGAISAFHADLAAYGMSDRVLIATWSEFGRRAAETANGGTDH